MSDTEPTTTTETAPETTEATTEPAVETTETATTKETPAAETAEATETAPAETSSLPFLYEINMVEEPETTEETEKPAETEESTIDLKDVKEALPETEPSTE